jgi:hypothetical protein
MDRETLLQIFFLSVYCQDCVSDVDVVLQEALFVSSVFVTQVPRLPVIEARGWGARGLKIGACASFNGRSGREDK